MNSKTFRLFARPSFVEGISRLVDIGTNLQVYNTCETEEEADEIAISSDWETVGNDIMTAYHEYST